LEWQQSRAELKGETTQTSGRKRDCRADGDKITIILSLKWYAFSPPIWLVRSHASQLSGQERSYRVLKLASTTPNDGLALKSWSAYQKVSICSNAAQAIVSQYCWAFATLATASFPKLPLYNRPSDLRHPNVHARLDTADGILDLLHRLKEEILRLIDAI